jgi:hypothetical protein
VAPSDSPVSPNGLKGLLSPQSTDGCLGMTVTVSDTSGRSLCTSADVSDPPTAPRVFIISDRQFYQQLAIQGIVTQAEALAAVGPGTLPSKLSSLISQLPAAAQRPLHKALHKGAVVPKIWSGKQRVSDLTFESSRPHQAIPQLSEKASCDFP